MVPRGSASRDLQLFAAAGAGRCPPVPPADRGPFLAGPLPEPSHLPGEVPPHVAPPLSKERLRHPIGSRGLDQAASSSSAGPGGGTNTHRQAPAPEAAAASRQGCGELPATATATVAVMGSSDRTRRGARREPAGFPCPIGATMATIIFPSRTPIFSGVPPLTTIWSWFLGFRARSRPADRALRPPGQGRRPPLGLRRPAGAPDPAEKIRRARRWPLPAPDLLDRVGGRPPLPRRLASTEREGG